MFSKATLQELKHAVCQGPLVRLRENADSAGAEGVHKVLTRSGACWSWRHHAYMFADLYPFGQAAPLIQLITERRRPVNRPDRGVVSCPQSIAELLWDYLQPRAGWKVLEPSAGHGVLAAEGAARGCIMDCHEIDNDRAADILRARIARRVSTGDFLAVPAQPTYDAVAMYPPHRLNLAVQHVLHAYQFLRPGGVLGALVSPGIQDAAGPRGQRLRDLLSCAGHAHVLGEGELASGYLLAPSGLRLGAQLVFLWADGEEK